MKIVIDIPEYIYKLCQGHGDIVYKYIGKGKPLPKGHGRLGDLDELEKRINNYIKQHAHMMDEFTVLNAKFIFEGIKDTSTIIEADK